MKIFTLNKFVNKNAKHTVKYKPKIVSMRIMHIFLPKSAKKMRLFLNLLIRPTDSNTIEGMTILNI